MILVTAIFILQIVCDTLLAELDKIPGDRRTLIGFITFTSKVQFYQMGEGKKCFVVLLSIVDQGDLWWFGHVGKMGDERMVKRL